MPLITQITIYAASIAAMLTFMRLIAGVSGSQLMRIYILKTTIISSSFLSIAAITKIFMQFSWFSTIINKHSETALTLSTTYFIVWLLLVSYFFGLGVIVRVYRRTLRFKGYGTFKNLRALPIVKFFKNLFSFKKDDKNDYATLPTSTRTNIEDDLWEKFSGNKKSIRQPVIITSDDPWELRKKLIKYCIELADKTNAEINYICCNVSPENIWNYVKEIISDENLIDKLKKRLVFVDSYTTTFGFEDEILKERSRKLAVYEKVDVVNSHSSAGIHAGTGKAFKLLKKKAEIENRKRRPCTVIYDSLSILAIPETEKEVAEFIIHLTAAELTYEMHTIFLESEIENRKSESLEAMLACCGSPIEVN